MTDSISAISSLSSSSQASSSSQILSDATKKKLEAMGIDTSQIKTETEGKARLQEVQAQQLKQVQAAQGNKGNSSESEIKQEASDLASKMSVTVGNDDKTNAIMDNIATKLSELKAAAGNDPTKTAEYQQFQSQYDDINQEMNQAQASKSMISNSLSGMANYNKVLLGLA